MMSKKIYIILAITLCTLLGAAILFILHPPKPTSSIIGSDSSVSIVADGYTSHITPHGYYTYTAIIDLTDEQLKTLRSKQGSSNCTAGQPCESGWMPIATNNTTAAEQNETSNFNAAVQTFYSSDDIICKYRVEHYSDYNTPPTKDDMRQWNIGSGGESLCMNPSRKWAIFTYLRT